jgi:hypothetical protein
MSTGGATLVDRLRVMREELEAGAGSSVDGFGVSGFGVVDFERPRVDVVVFLGANCFCPTAPFSVSSMTMLMPEVGALSVSFPLSEYSSSEVSASGLLGYVRFFSLLVHLVRLCLHCGHASVPPGAAH